MKKVKKLFMIVSHGIVSLIMWWIALFLIAQLKKFNLVSAKNLTRFPGAGRKSVFSENMMNGLKAFYFEQRELTTSVSVVQLRIYARSISEAEVDAILSTNVLKQKHAIYQQHYRLLSKWDQS
jgi:hypothetical protein